MDVSLRLALWILAAAVALLADVVTKSLPHESVVNHYAEVPIVPLVLVGLGLLLIGARYSPAVAVGSGLMFGGLCGNGGEILIHGYATDWIPIGGWRTNIADTAAALGFVSCCTAYARLLARQWAQRRREEGQP